VTLASFVAATTSVLLVGAAAARADDTPPEHAPPPHRIELLEHVDGRVAQRHWIARGISNMRLHKRGLSYTQHFERPTGDLELTVRAPGMGRKRFGLSVELKF